MIFKKYIFLKNPKFFERLNICISSQVFIIVGLKKAQNLKNFKFKKNNIKTVNFKVHKHYKYFEKKQAESKKSVMCV